MANVSAGGPFAHGPPASFSQCVPYTVVGSFSLTHTISVTMAQPRPQATGIKRSAEDSAMNRMLCPCPMRASAGISEHGE